MVFETMEAKLIAAVLFGAIEYPPDNEGNNIDELKLADTTDVKDAGSAVLATLVLVVLLAPKEEEGAPA